MKISIISVGKIKEAYLEAAITHWKKQIGKYHDIELIEVPDEKTPDQLSVQELKKITQIEGQKILDKIPDQAFVVALAIEGKQLSSKQFRRLFLQAEERGSRQIVFIIGGSLGLSELVLKRANEKISFSKMTFPHQLMKVVLMEQIHFICDKVDC